MREGTRGAFVEPTSDEEHGLMCVSTRTDDRNFQRRLSPPCIGSVCGVVGISLCGILVLVLHNGVADAGPTGLRALAFFRNASEDVEVTLGRALPNASAVTLASTTADPGATGDHPNFVGDDIGGDKLAPNHLQLGTRASGGTPATTSSDPPVVTSAPTPSVADTAETSVVESTSSANSSTRAAPTTTDVGQRPEMKVNRTTTTVVKNSTTVRPTTITTTILIITTVASTTTKKVAGPNSLFCFLLCIPWGTEIELIRWQYQNKKAIFGCDVSSVYSNITVDFGGKSLIVNTPLEAAIGGQWNTRLNTPIFVALWTQVVKDGHFRQAAWSVKVDPDAVFLPDRLYDLVQTPLHSGAQDGNGMFSNNCEYQKSMHGPVELFSRRAVEVLGERGHQECQVNMVHGPGVGNSETFTNLMVEWGQEDVFMRKCMELLGAKEINDWKLLAEDSCHWDWQTCEGDRVTFHPYKTLKAYQGCLWRAEHADQSKWMLAQ